MYIFKVYVHEKKKKKTDKTTRTTLKKNMWKWKMLKKYSIKINIMHWKRNGAGNPSWFFRGDHTQYFLNYGFNYLFLDVVISIHFLKFLMYHIRAFHIQFACFSSNMHTNNTEKKQTWSTECVRVVLNTGACLYYVQKKPFFRKWFLFKININRPKGQYTVQILKNKKAKNDFIPPINIF